jgi:hypothetical protein
MRQAVNATLGSLSATKGGVVESLYAASDAIVAEAFQGRGMSQLGGTGPWPRRGQATPRFWGTTTPAQA